MLLDGRGHFVERDLEPARLGVEGIDVEAVPFRRDDAAQVADALAGRELRALEARAVVLLDDDDVTPATPLAEHVADASLAAVALGLSKMDDEDDREARMGGQHHAQV